MIAMCCCYYCSNVSSLQAQDFQTLLGFENSIESPANMIETPDGNLLLVATQSANGDDNAFVAKIDAQGNLLWQNKYGSPTASEKMSDTPPIEFTPDGYLITARRNTATFWRFLISPQGVLLNESTQPVPLFGAKPAEGGGYFMAENVGGYGWLSRFDEQGVFHWKIQIQNFSQFSDFRPTVDGGCLIIGEEYAGNWIKKAWKYNAHAQKEWELEIPPPPVNLGNLNVAQQSIHLIGNAFIQVCNSVNYGGPSVAGISYTKTIYNYEGKAIRSSVSDISQGALASYTSFFYTSRKSPFLYELQSGNIANNINGGICGAILNKYNKDGKKICEYNLPTPTYLAPGCIVPGSVLPYSNLATAGGLIIGYDTPHFFAQIEGDIKLNLYKNCSFEQEKKNNLTVENTGAAVYAGKNTLFLEGWGAACALQPTFTYDPANQTFYIQFDNLYLNDDENIHCGYDFYRKVIDLGALPAGKYTVKINSNEVQWKDEALKNFHFVVGVEPPFVSPQLVYLCNGGTLSDAFLAQGSNIRWYDANQNLLVQGSGFVPDQAGYYYCTQSINDIESNPTQVEVLDKSIKGYERNYLTLDYQGSSLFDFWRNNALDLLTLSSDDSLIIQIGNTYPLHLQQSTSFPAAEAESVYTLSLHSGYGCEITEQFATKAQVPEIPDYNYCNNNPPALYSAGGNIRWYRAADSALLHSGNSFVPDISEKTRFFVTNTVNGVESEPEYFTIYYPIPFILEQYFSHQVQIITNSDYEYNFSINGEAVPFNNGFYDSDHNNALLIVQVNPLGMPDCVLEETIPLIGTVGDTTIYVCQNTDSVFIHLNTADTVYWYNETGEYLTMNEIIIDMSDNIDVPPNQSLVRLRAAKVFNGNVGFKSTVDIRSSGIKDVELEYDMPFLTLNNPESQQIIWAKFKGDPISPQPDGSFVIEENGLFEALVALKNDNYNLDCGTSFVSKYILMPPVFEKYIYEVCDEDTLVLSPQNSINTHWYDAQDNLLAVGNTFAAALPPDAAMTTIKAVNEYAGTQSNAAFITLKSVFNALSEYLKYDADAYTKILPAVLQFNDLPAAYTYTVFLPSGDTLSLNENQQVTLNYNFPIRLIATDEEISCTKSFYIVPPPFVEYTCGSAERYAYGEHIRWYKKGACDNYILIQEGNYFSLPENMLYYVSQTLNGAEESHLMPVVGGMAGGGDTIEYTMGANGNQIEILNANATAEYTILLNGNPVENGSVLPTNGDVRIYAVYPFGGCPSDSTSFYFYYTPPPALIAAHYNFCVNEDALITANGTDLRWYADAALTELLAEGDVFTPTAEGTYYVVQSIYGTRSEAAIFTVNFYLPFNFNCIEIPTPISPQNVDINITNVYHFGSKDSSSANAVKESGKTTPFYIINTTGGSIPNTPQLKVRPVPAADYLFVEYTDLSAATGTLLLRNAAGQIVCNIKGYGCGTAVEVSALPHGVYAAEFFSDKGQWSVAKWVK